ncbi:MAG: hypothetical protein EXR71_00970 [Myxococcales bacterium]|nr:hypothetical protein [Myxococcales bacterium]
MRLRVRRPERRPGVAGAGTSSWRWLRRLGLVGGGLVVGLVVAEAVGRADGLIRGNDLVFSAPMSYPKDIYVRDGPMTYPNPHFTGTIQSFGYSVTPHFSSWGTRGAEPVRGTRTWLMVGDSFTIGLQVDDDQTFSARLAETLGIQVLNAGVDGYSTWREAIRTVQLGRHFSPEVVVAVFFTGNDFFDNRQEPPLTLDAPGLGPGEPGAPEYGLPPVGIGLHTALWFRVLRDHSVLAAHYWAWHETARVRRGRDPNARRFREELGIFTVEGQARADDDHPATIKALTSFREACALVGARALVAVVPPAFIMDDATARRTFASVGLEKVTPDLDGAQTAAFRAAAAAGVPSCDLLPALREAARRGDRPFLPFDGHLTVEGHRVVAAGIAACVGG